MHFSDLSLVLAILPQELANHTVANFFLISYFMAIFCLTFGTFFALFDSTMMYLTVTFDLTTKGALKFSILIYVSIYAMALMLSTTGGPYLYYLLFSSFYHANLFFLQLLVMVSAHIYGKIHYHFLPNFFCISFYLIWYNMRHIFFTLFEWHLLNFHVNKLRLKWRRRISRRCFRLL